MCWSTLAYSVFQGGVDRTVMWPVPKQDGKALPAWTELFVLLDLLRSTPKCKVLLVLGGCFGVPEYYKIIKSSPPLVNKSFDKIVIIFLSISLNIYSGETVLLSTQNI